MSELSIDDIRRALVAKQLRHEQAREAAEEVRDELLMALSSERLPNLSPMQVARARKAQPVGKFPSHKVLMECFGDLL